MKCKNCGTELKETARVCPNCGAFVDDSSGYTLLTADSRLDDFYSDAPAKKRKSGFVFFISLLLTLAIIGGGAYYYFNNIKPRQSETPDVSFTSGSGIINENEPVIYVSIDNNPNIQYIHGVSLYKADYSESGVPKDAVAVSNDYEYTKNIDDTFRAIFFNAEGLDLKKNEVYSFTFEVKLGFVGSDEIFTYVQKAEISGDIKDNAADIIFDHTKSGMAADDSNAVTKTEENQAETTKATTKANDNEKADTAFINEGYWFTNPYTEGNLKTIFALRFNKDNTFVSTRYEKNGDADWAVSTFNGSYTLENGYIVATDSEGGEKTYYKIGNKTLAEEKDGETVQTLTNRKYNSVKNAEDFFGI